MPCIDVMNAISASSMSFILELVFSCIISRRFRSAAASASGS